MKYKAFEKHYHLMLFPGVVLLIMFQVIPMFGIVMAFQNFKIGKGIWGSDWVGLENFNYLFQMSDSRQIFINTIFIALCKIAANLIVPLVFAILLNELRLMAVKRFVQTIVYLPHFLSWVILASILIDLLSLNGIVNTILKAMGMDPIMFLANNSWFRFIVISSDVWKEFGFGAIVYLAAVTGINPSLFEAAVMDGATRWQKIRYIVIPSLIPTTVLLATLALGNILNAGFDQIFNLYNPMVYQGGDIIDTYVYRAGLINAQFGLATAIGLIKSIIGFVLIIVSYKLASKYANYRIF